MASELVVRGSLRLPSTVTPESFGARGDGVTDDTVAVQRAFDAGSASVTVALTPGRVYAHRGVLHVRREGQHVVGAATLLATAEATSSVWIEADDVTLEDATLATATTTRRFDAWEQMGLRLVGHEGITVRRVTVRGSAAAGVYVGGSGGFLLDRVTVTGTRADGIHMTSGAHDGRVVSPLVSGSGDDGVAVVSYAADGTACHDITVTSPTVRGTTWGRGVSVVGGTRITVRDLTVSGTSAAGVYLGTEGAPWNTTAATDVLVDGGTVTDANRATGVDHGAVFVLAGRIGVAPANITVRRLTVSGTRPTASRNLGVVTYGTPPTNVLFSDIAIAGGPRLAYSGNTPASSYRLVRVTHDGLPVSRTGRVR